MNFTDIGLIVMTTLAGLFALYIGKMKNEMRWKEAQKELDSMRQSFWTSHDRLEERVDRLEKACASCCTNDKKNYYNTGA